MGMITAMFSLSHQLQVPRTISGVKIPHPCGEPRLSSEKDSELRRDIVITALNAMATPVSEPTVFRPAISIPV